MLEDFINRANIKCNDYLLKTEALFVTNKNAWFSDFAEHFQSVCAQILTMQLESSLSAISCLEYTMLYTNFINRRYFAEIRLYGNESYLDKNQRTIGDYDISFLFIYFDKLWDDLLKLRKRYVGKVSARDVKAFMLQVLPDFYSYLANIVRFAIMECVENKPYTDIEKNEEFMVNVGAYMAETEYIFVENKNKDADKLSKWFDEEHEKEYVCGDYSDLDFSRRFFNYIDFSYSQFRRSNLSHSSLEGSSLVGVSFREANMEECCLDSCSIHEADFSRAILKKATFFEVEARTGFEDESEWRHVGFLPVSFCGADLTGAEFSGAELIEADFSCAELNGADFQTADLTGAIFSGAMLTGTDFSDAYLVGADFTGAALTDAVFTDAIMDKARIDAARKSDLALSREQLAVVIFV